MTCSPWLLRLKLQWAQVQQGLLSQTILASALTFALLHLMYDNAIAVLLTLVGGLLETAYRGATTLTFGGGVNEVQRDIIAAAGLGMPRARARK